MANLASWPPGTAKDERVAPPATATHRSAGAVAGCEAISVSSMTRGPPSAASDRDFVLPRQEPTQQGEGYLRPAQHENTERVRDRYVD
jgi:hypothetical protein